MNDRTRLRVLVLGMAGVAGLIAAAAIGVLYEAAFESERSRLVWAAKSQTRVLEAIARHETADHPGLGDLATDAAVAQIRDAYGRYGGIGRTGTLMIGRRSGTGIVYLCHGRPDPDTGASHADRGAPSVLPFESPLAEPMRRALAGQSGTMTALDHHGMRVLAAYEPVPGLGLGFVAKIALAEIRAPYFRAGAVVAALAAILIGVGVYLTTRIAAPVAERAAVNARQLAKVAANMPGVVFQRLQRSDGSVVYPLISDGIREIYGFEPDAVMADPGLFRAAIHPDDRDSYWAAAKRSEESGRPLIKDIRIITRRGDTKWVHVQARPDRLGSGEVMWDGVITDITERKRAESELLNSERKYRCVTESANDAIVSVDGAGAVVSWNAAAERLFGYGKPEILGESLERLIPERCRDSHRKGFEGADRQSSSAIAAPVREVVGLTKDGREVPLELTVGHWRGEGAAHHTAIIRDVTERRRLEDEKERLTAAARQAQKLEALGTLAGGIAHDVNNTLVPILGLTELIIEDLPEESSFLTDLELVLTAARRTKRLVRQILTFSREEETDREVLDLEPLVGETLDLLRSTIPTSVEIRGDLEPVRVEADATGIYQILMNLSVNGADAMAPKGGVLSIALKSVDLGRREAAHIPGLAPGRYAKLTVADTGPGMDAATAGRIFDPFFTTKPVGAGTGMGLTVVHGLVAAHGGAITVASDPGRGTAFDIYLPAAEAGDARGHGEDGGERRVA